MAATEQAPQDYRNRVYPEALVISLPNSDGTWTTYRGFRSCCYSPDGVYYDYGRDDMMFFVPHDTLIVELVTDNHHMRNKRITFPDGQCMKIHYRERQTIA